MTTEIKTDKRQEYHDDHSATSHSMLEVFRENVAEYHGRFVSHAIPAPEPTPEMEFGSLTHLFVLEPDLFEQSYFVLEPPEDGGKWDRRTTAYKQMMKDRADEMAGKQIIDEEVYTKLWCIRESIRNHPKAGQIIERCEQRELVIRWTDPATGLACKAMLDGLGTGLACDLKTASDISPEGFAKACHNFGYHRQQAFYRDGLAAGDNIAVPFVFVCVTKKPPYDCAVYELTDRSVELGAAQNAADMAKLKDRIASGDWRNDWAKRINTLDLPKYAFYENPYQIGE